ncbi:hypothetical protein FPFC_020200 [Fructobacillus pseudoficulneus]|uniref:YdbS-like PH domain-containing protein n=1 Tax=Fructobacillus pseudoficulneus TaxID=220714 RepID=A0A3F3H855_9LACO|nr:PH domain-containing protein [Fructobacillus pseudoficulneus]GAP02573.1 hypothetical protein FPFC_020200 [Fructobacillus pseudoficulneus]SEH38298.1 hypothetical protein SAMN05660469_0509 [Fructobacillus pseudoficulneus]
MKALPKQVKSVWYWSEAMTIVIVLGLYFVGIWAVNQFTKVTIPTSLFWLILAAIILLSLGGLGLVHYRYAFYHYSVNEMDVEIQKGFFFRKWIAIPIDRIQNVNLNQGPLLLAFKLQEVTIVTGGSDYSIDALTEAEAESFKDQVMTLAKEARHDA